MSNLSAFTDGLITKQTPVILPPSASDMLVNMDIDETGLLRKRQGTEASAVPFRRFFHTKTVAGVDLLVSLEEPNIVVYDSSMSRVIYTVSNAYAANITFNTFNAINVNTITYSSVVLLAEAANPIQIFIHYNVSTLQANYSTLILPEPKWVGTSQIKFFHLGAPLTALSVSTVSGEPICVFTPTGEDRTIVSMYFSFGAWFNSTYFFGDELTKTVVRTDSKIIQVPPSLLTKLEDSTKPYVQAFDNNGVPYNYNNQPRYYDDYYYSDRSYTYEAGTSLSFSPYFAVFGQRIYERTIDLSISNVDVSNNLIRFATHNLEENTTVVFENQAPGGVTLGTEYVVVDVTANTFRLQGVTLTSQLSTSLPDIILRASLINNNHKFTTAGLSNITKPSPYKVYSASLLPPSLVNGVTYWLTVSSNELSLFFDESAKYPVLVSRFKTLSFDSADVDVTTNVITINGHSWASGVPVAVVSATAPTGITVGTTYWVFVVSANEIKLATSSTLTSFVDITGAGSDTYLLTEDWNNWKFVPDYTDGSIKVINSGDVLFSRIRRLDLGEVSSSIRVVVDGVEYTRSLGGTLVNSYLITDSNFVVSIGYYGNNSYISFASLPTKALPSAAFVQLINIAKASNTGSFAIGTTYNNYYANNTVITVYGYGDRFPLTAPVDGVVIQNRLVLATYNTLVFSNVSDSFIKGQFYNNLAVDDRLTGDLSEQFTLTIADDSPITALVDYQGALIVFTENTVYRITNLTYNQYVITRIANQGVSTAQCVAQLHSLIVYYNKFGVFTLKTEVEGTYYADELSAAISNELNKHEPVLIEFIRVSNKLVVVSKSRIYALDTRSGKWTEYRLPWTHGIVTAFQLNNQLTLSDENRALTYTFNDCFYDYLYTVKAATPIQTVSVNANGELLIDGSVVLPRLSQTGNAIIPYCGTYVGTDFEELRLNYRNVTGYTVYKTPVFQFDSLPINTLPINTWSTVKVGYPVSSICITGATRSQNLSLNSQVVNLELVIGLDTQPDFKLGVIFGNDNKPEWMNAADVDITDNAVYAILKESLQGVSSSYRLIVVSDNSTDIVLSGYSFLERSDNAPTYYSGGT